MSNVYINTAVSDMITPIFSQPESCIFANLVESLLSCQSRSFYCQDGIVARLENGSAELLMETRSLKCV